MGRFCRKLKDQRHKSDLAGASGSFVRERIVLPYVVNCAAMPDGRIAFWFEVTSLDALLDGELMTGSAIGSVQRHPFTWECNPKGTYLDDVCEIGVPGADITVGWFSLRLPVVSKSVPKPSPSNWIELGDEFPKKSGLEKFAVPAITFARPLSITEMSSFVDALFDPDSVLDAGTDYEPIAFVRSPSVLMLEQVIALAESLYLRRRFLPALERRADASTVADASWHSVLDRSDAVRVNEMAERGPGEFFSFVGWSRGAKAHGPSELIHRIVDSLVETSVREAILVGDPDLNSPHMGSKPFDALVFALTRPLKHVSPQVGAQSRISEVLDEWRTRVLRHLEPAHLAIRISPPGFFDPSDYIADDDWEVALGLYPAHNTAEFIDSASLVAARDRLGTLELNPASAELLFLRKLKAASQYSSELAAVLTNAHPNRFSLPPEAVIDFVSRTATVLAEQESVALVLPKVLRDAIKPRIKVSSAPLGSNRPMLGLSAIFSFEARVQLGERELGVDEIRHLIAAASPVVKVGSEWIFVDQDGLAKALRYLERHKGRTEMTLSELIGDPMDDIEFGDVVEIERPDPAELIAALNVTKSMGPVSFVEPEGFSLPLRPYQRRGVEWLASLGRTGLGACLADDMGLGKTAQVIALLAMEHEFRKSPESKIASDLEELGSRDEPSPLPISATLIIAPVSVVNNWRREIARFYPRLNVHVHHGPRRLVGDAFIEAATGVDVVVTSYSLLARDVELLSCVTWTRVVLDEAQNIKNPMTLTARAASALHSSSRIALTGTPVENHTGELWSIMDFLNPSILGSRGSFRKRFSIPIERGGDKRATQRLVRVVSPFILRRLKTDKTIIADLPDKLELKEYCGLSDDQQYLYAQTVVQLQSKLTHASVMERRGAILASITRLKQICNHPSPDMNAARLTGRSGKLDRLEELLGEILESGEKAIIFTQFATFATALQRHLQERLAERVLLLKGDVPITRRDAMVLEFQENGGPSIFVLSLKAGGTGLNLTAANHVIHYDRWWNSAVEAQATDRAFRIGQRKDVVVSKLICEGTLEERIDEMIEAKKELAETLVGGGETWITEMSDSEVLELLSFSSAD